MPAWLEIAAAAGNALGGAAAVIGVAYAVVEFRSWKARQRAETRAAAAARALPVLEAFALSVTHWMNAFAVAAFDSRGLSGVAALEHVAGLMDHARAEVETRQKELARAGAEAEAVLAPEEVAPLRVANGVYIAVGVTVWQSARSAAVRWDQEAAVGRNPAPMNLHEIVEGPLRELEQKLEGALRDARKVLGAIARHERVPEKAD